MKNWVKIWRRWREQSARTPLSERALLARHLSLMLRSGLTLSDALAVVAGTAKGALGPILRAILLSVQSGQNFSQALDVYPKIFSGLFVSAVYMGERSGTLAENLANVATQLEKDRQLVAKVKNAMVYPVIVVALTVILALALSFFVLPKMVPLFAGLQVTLPWTTRALLAFSRFMAAHGLAAVISVMAFFIFSTLILRRAFAAPFTHGLAIITPGFGRLAKNGHLARLCRTLGLLLKSGVPIDESLVIAGRTIGNFYFIRALVGLAKTVQGGRSLASGFADYPHLFPPLLLAMVKVGEESGRFEETLLYLGDYFEEEVEASVKTLTTALEPILLLGLGVMVAFFALAIITPIYEITSSFKP